MKLIPSGLHGTTESVNHGNMLQVKWEEINFLIYLIMFLRLLYISPKRSICTRIIRIYQNSTLLMNRASRDGK